MNKFLLISVACLAIVLAAEQYDSKYDNVDWKGIMENERLARNYVDCLLGKKTCPNDGAYLKSVIPEALESDCAKCSEKQKEAVRTVLSTMYKKKPEWFAELQAEFDPEKKYFKKYEKDLEAAKV